MDPKVENAFRPTVIVRKLTEEEARACAGCKSLKFVKGTYVCLANRKQRRKLRCFKK
jgi:hypothetical protein